MLIVCAKNERKAKLGFATLIFKDVLRMSRLVNRVSKCSNQSSQRMWMRSNFYTLPSIHAINKSYKIERKGRNFHPLKVTYPQKMEPNDPLHTQLRCIVKILLSFSVFEYSNRLKSI